MSFRKERSQSPSVTRKDRERSKPAHQRKLLIAGIGASAGGIEALQQFFQAMPADTGLAFVVVVHLSPEHQSHLAEILAGCTAMPAEQVRDNTNLKPNHIYVIPPDRELKLTGTSVNTLPFHEPQGKRNPIDTFFCSLAAQHGNGFAVVLSGGGSDGATGVKAVKDAGGIVLAQEPAEAVHGSMPEAAVASGADIVLPVKKLAIRLAELAQDRQDAMPDKLKEPDKKLLTRILGHLYARTGHDFSKYKQSTILRRLARRMQVHRIDTFEGYFTFLQKNPDEIQALFNDLLISVTAFFRDPEAFDVLSQKVIPRLFDNRPPESFIRVWVPGCATGEEAYSLAMLLLEEAEHRDEWPKIQVFASDLDEIALAIAREGCYPSSIEDDVPAERLRRFFIRENNHYRVRKELRDCVLFAAHNLLRDPPFSRIDLVSCRNLLIYLDRELQEQAFAVIRYALRSGGFLFLGASENADNPYFRTVDKKHRIYTTRDNGQKPPRLPDQHLGGPRLHSPGPGRQVSTEPSPLPAVHRSLLEELAPPSVLVNEHRVVLNLSETAGRFLHPRGGPLSQDIAELVREELQTEVRAALFRAFDKAESTLSPFVPVHFNGAPRLVAVSVIPRQVDEDEEKLALVVFIEGGEARSAGPHEPGNKTETATVQHLREELQHMQERLQQARKEQETAQEEYRSANEELQSINEEYRSTAEELETSKEELQSINEELETVNNELNNKLEEISRAHSDLENLMAATDIGTLFLDADLRIRRFTSPLTDFFSVTPADVGRAIGDFTTSLDYRTLEEDARQVLTRLTPIERETRSQREGKIYLARLRPYRTVNDGIDGVVISFVDVTGQKKTEAELRVSQERLGHELAAIGRLHEMTMDVVAADSMSEAIDRILDAAIDIQGTSQGIIHLKNPETNALEITAHRGLERETLGMLETLSNLDNSAYRRALHTGRHVVMKKITGKPDREIAEKAGYRAMRITPLVNQDDIALGVLSTYFHEPHPLTVHDERLLDLLGRHAANLLDRLHSELALKKLNEELKQNESKLKQQAKQLRDNDRRRTDFLAMLGHELRNPLSAIRNSIGLIAAVKSNDTGHESSQEIMDQALAILERQGRLMTRLVNDLLDIARINKDKIELAFGSVALTGCVESAVAALRTEMEAKKLEFTARLPDEPLYLYADEERLLQILDNLLNNAVKFTEPGGWIELSATREDGYAVIRVKDNGMGIPGNSIDSIFEQFTYAQNSSARAGLGLGLSLVKNLVGLHNGTITAHSDGPGKGSEFILRLPLTRFVPSGPGDGGNGNEAVGPFRILVVDDSADAADCLASLLRTQNHDVEVAYDGESACAVARRLRPQIALLDLNMPAVDGYELARRLRREFPPDTLTLIAVSGRIQHNRIREAGFDRHLLKPVDLDMINEVLASLV